MTITPPGSGVKPQRNRGNSASACAARNVRGLHNVLSVVLFMIQVVRWPVTYISLLAISVRIDTCAYEACGSE